MSRYNEHGLTARQETFAQAYVRTLSGAEAYREAYSTKTKRENTIHSEASRLLANRKVTARVHRVQNGKVAARVTQLRKSMLSTEEPQGLNSSVSQFEPTQEQ